MHIFIAPATSIIIIITIIKHKRSNYNTGQRLSSNFPDLLIQPSSESWRLEEGESRDLALTG